MFCLHPMGKDSLISYFGTPTEVDNGEKEKDVVKENIYSEEKISDTHSVEEDENNTWGFEYY